MFAKGPIRKHDRTRLCALVDCSDKQHIPPAPLRARLESHLLCSHPTQLRQSNPAANRLAVSLRPMRAGYVAFSFADLRRSLAQHDENPADGDDDRAEDRPEDRLVAPQHPAQTRRPYQRSVNQRAQRLPPVPTERLVRSAQDPDCPTKRLHETARGLQAG